MENHPQSIVVPELSNSDFFNGRIAWPTIQSAANLLATAEPIEVIDLSKVRHMRPYQVAIVAAIAEDQHLRGLQVSYCPPDDSDAREHLNRLGLPEIVLRKYGGSLKQRPTNLPILVLKGRAEESFGYETTKALIRELGRDLPAGLEQKIAGCIDEMVLNAATHAESEIGCVVVGQAFPRTGKLEVAVLDLGVTIRGHLSKNPKHQDLSDDASAIERALEDGVTGTIGRNRFGEPNSGAGFASLCRFLDATGGDVSILSGSAIVCRRARGAPRVQPLKCPPFRGTLVNISFATPAGF
jgi:anti-sigma regulatory factor (Ser/Thr protein kinase)